MVVELGSSSPLSPSNLKRFGLLLFIGFYLSIFTNSFCFVLFVNKHHCIITLLPIMASSNFKPTTGQDRKCSVKFPKYELTIHTNTWYTFLGCGTKWKVTSFSILVLFTLHGGELHCFGKNCRFFSVVAPRYGVMQDTSFCCTSGWLF
jgi:hypothetical protein